MKKLLLLSMLLLSTVCQAAPKTENGRRFIVYLPLYKKNVDVVAFLKTVNWETVTDLDLAFLNPPPCAPTCTAQSDMSFSSPQHTNEDIDQIVSFAHEKGIRVLASIGGGGNDSPVPALYNAGLSEPMVASLSAYVVAHKLDGVDVDVELPDQMGVPYAQFVTLLVHELHGKKKLVTAAVAKYVQSAMPDVALHQFDWINVMAYTSYDAAGSLMNFYAFTKNVPRDRIVLGVPFYGQGAGSLKADYSVILSAYPNAWRVDTVGGGSLDDGASITYVGEETMSREVQLGRKYGGVMVWQIMADAAGPHSLMSVIRLGMIAP